jgi:hypothetical protein
LVFDESTGPVPDFGVACGFAPEWAVVLELAFGLVVVLGFALMLENAPAFEGPLGADVECRARDGRDCAMMASNQKR